MVGLQRGHRAEQPPAPGAGDRVVQAGQVVDRGDQPGQRRVRVRAELQPLRAARGRVQRAGGAAGRAAPGTRNTSAPSCGPPQAAASSAITSAPRLSRSSGANAAAAPEVDHQQRPDRLGALGHGGHVHAGARARRRPRSARPPGWWRPAGRRTARPAARRSPGRSRPSCTAAPAALRGAHPRRHVGHVVQTGHHHLVAEDPGAARRLRPAGPAAPRGWAPAPRPRGSAPTRSATALRASYSSSVTMRRRREHAHRAPTAARGTRWSSRRRPDPALACRRWRPYGSSRHPPPGSIPGPERRRTPCRYGSQATKSAR